MPPVERLPSTAEEPARAPAPDGPVPDGPVPDGPVPDGPVPDDRVPDDRVPDGPVPDDRVPDDRVPDDRVPDGPVPDDRVPDHTALGTAAPETAAPRRAPASVTVRYWAAARAAAGVAQESLPGATVGAVLDAARGAHPALAAVLPACTLLVDGRSTLRAEPVHDGAVLEVLPPFAGG